MGRVALVTGGTRGIGAAIAKALKKAGYNVAANYGGNDDAAKAFKKETKIPVFKWNVGDYLACEAGIVNVENEVGPVEVLVNNAGISRDAMLQKMTHEQWSEVIRTNLDSLFNMTRPVINGMRERGFGRVINISSINGQKGQLGLTNYCSAKAGVIGFTRALALESARKGITVNAIAPGYIKTDMTDIEGINDPAYQPHWLDDAPMKRFALPEEITPTIVYMASEASAFMTGSIVVIDGGYTVY